MDRIIQKAAKTIQDLGIATQAMLNPYLEQWTNRPVGTDTTDEDSILAGFLTDLFKAKLITRKQGRTLLQMLTSEEPAPLPTDDPYIGRRFGEFVAEEKVGEGAMGKVYRATREGTLERNFVIKVFTALASDVGMARFRREGEVMADLRHEHIVKVIVAGQEGDTPFLVLEYIDGPTLQKMLDQRGKFSWKSATRAAKQIAMALNAAHEKGVIHRDIKPANILVERGGLLKVFDFGLAKAHDSKGVSQAGEILGSPAFMAPEQWGDHEVDGRADLFALGVVYYLLITGEVPFKGRTPSDYSTAIRQGTFKPLHELAPDAPLGVSHVVTQLLERDRAQRPPSARVLINDLDRILRQKWPNVPRLEPADGDAEGDRFALIGAEEFKVSATDMEATIFIDAGGIETDHATLSRTPGGMLLKATSPTAIQATLVNGNPVREIVLRDKDTVQFGNAPKLRYRSGNLSSSVTSRFSPPSDRLSASSAVSESLPDLGPPIVVPGLLATALTHAAHPRLLQACFEALDLDALEVQLELTRARLNAIGLPSEVADRAVERGRSFGEDRVRKIADRLFGMTHENLGRAVEPWLAWWFEVRGRYPRQLRGPGSRARGRLVIKVPGGDRSEVELDEGELFTLGRGEEVEITIPERSVSRKHATILRLNTRFAIKDLGSRFGTTIGKERLEVSLLSDGDKLEMGKARCRFVDVVAASPEERTATGGGALVEIDPHAFRALVEMRDPSTLVTLVRLLDSASLAEFCVQGASPHEDFTSVGAHVMAFLDAERERALEALPAISDVNLGSEPGPWQAWLNERAATLSAQVVPTGWTE